MNRLAAAALLLALLGAAVCGNDGERVVERLYEPTFVTLPPPLDWAKVSPEQIAEAKRLGLPVAFENDKFGMRFVLIPAGTFLMGSPEAEEGRGDNEAQREVTIEQAFYMQITEVTNRQYRITQGGSYDGGSEEGISLSGDTHPVAVNGWDAALTTAWWVTGHLGYYGSDRTREYRLPTKEEWEYACRAGSHARYFFGDRAEDLVRYANFSDKNHPTAPKRPDLDDGHALTAPVGRYAPNPWGLYDMHGNVWEWCGDEPLPPPGLTPGSQRGPPPPTHTGCLRGGSYASPVTDLRAARWRRPTGEESDVDENAHGFRLVSPLPKGDLVVRFHPMGKPDKRLVVEGAYVQHGHGITHGESIERGHEIRVPMDPGQHWNVLIHADGHEMQRLVRVEIHTTRDTVVDVELEPVDPDK